MTTTLSRKEIALVLAMMRSIEACPYDERHGNVDKQPCGCWDSLKAKLETK